MDAAFEQQIPHVYRFALRLCRHRETAEEIVQETMLRAWRSRRQLRRGDCVRAWILRIAVNYWRDRLRRGAPDSFLTTQDDLPAVQPTVEGLAEVREDLRAALDAMNSLPERQRTVLHLRACEGLAPDEIGNILGISTGAVKASLSLARKKMRIALMGVRDVPCTNGQEREP